MFGHGGLQRDCIAIARRLRARGHDVEIVCTASEVTLDDVPVVVLPVTALTNHGRNAAFSRKFARYATANTFDVVAGFDALEGLDVLYCANPPVRMSGTLDRLNPRKRAFLALERACFGPESRTRLLLLSGAQRTQYDTRWHLTSARVTMIPPTIDPARIVAREARASVRAATRAALGLKADDLTWLFVGSFPKTKGLDRLIDALPEFLGVRVLCVGPSGAAVPPFRAQAERLGVASRVKWLGGRDDVPALMVASDCLVHPSRLDVTGTVLLEAIANGLPVVTTAVCGYAPHVIAADAGYVVPEPFARETLVDALRTFDVPLRRTNADRYAETTDLTSGLDVAAETIAATSRK